MKMTLERVREARLSIAMLPTKEDVDDLASWRRAHGALPPLAVEALRHA
jgi:hypothetical protein